MYKICSRSSLLASSVLRPLPASCCLRAKASEAGDSYKSTLNLPNSGAFELSMKNICKIEAQISKSARFDELYEWQEKHRSVSEAKPLVILHDGPPYANGDIHMGHMVNKVLKDIYLRYKLVSGHRVHYMPGWDCHGLPIELNVLKAMKKSAAQASSQNEKVELRRQADRYSNEYIGKQMSSFKEMNLLANWSQYYRTKDVNYMCRQLDLFLNLYEKNLIYRDYTPVYWSPWSNTALAEFELEYNNNHVSNAFYVAYKCVDYPDKIRQLVGPEQSLYALIWTTTPWSLPFNKAIAFNSDLTYSLVRNDDRVYIVADELVQSIVATIPALNGASVVAANIKAADCFENAKSAYLNPFSVSERDRLYPFLHGEHVSAKQGTGLVHTAPALGHDDFKLAQKHGLSTRCFIDERGHLNPTDGLSSPREGDEAQVLDKFGLKDLFAFNKNTTNRIREALHGSLLHENEHKHSYPYDWRSKKPVLIRSSLQWFINTNRLKDKALERLKDVAIRPSNVKNSMSTTLANRPYWCISRQRAWGLPIPCFFEQSDPTRPVINRPLIESMKTFIKSSGSADFWWTDEKDAELVKSLDKSPETTFSKSKDIFDIWFDSGCSFNNLKDFLPDAAARGQKADLYCEGVDQFSGWFQSSLLLSVAFEEQSPYKSLLVHGFVVDEENRKMSKSIGNIIEPKQAIHGSAKLKLPQCGLDVLRFWVAQDFHKPQIQIGSNILNKYLKRVFEIRSLVRFLVANLSDLGDNKHGLLQSFDDLRPFDKFILADLKRLRADVLANYEDMNFSKVVLLLENFFLTNLSSFYVKSIRDRLYCEHKNSYERKSAQTALYHILVNTLVLMAPIMPHLAEEAYHHSCLKTTRAEASFFRSEHGLVDHESKFLGQISPETAAVLDRQYAVITQLRESFFEQIKSNNPANYHVDLELDAQLLALLADQKSSSHDWLIECFGCSSMRVQRLHLLTSSPHHSLSAVKITGKFACLRCRRLNAESESSVCRRCQEVLNQQQF